MDTKQELIELISSINDDRVALYLLQFSKDFIEKYDNGDGN